MTSSPPEDEAPPPAVGPPVVAYAAALAVYIGLGYLLRSVVLNWIVGPLFLVAALHLLPRLARSRPRGPSAGPGPPSAGRG